MIYHMFYTIFKYENFYFKHYSNLIPFSLSIHFFVLIKTDGRVKRNEEKITM